MQLYAFDVNKQLTFSLKARKQTDYICPECRGVVRLRGGFHRQNHFYHLEATRACRQSGKSGQHLALQSCFLEKLPKGDCILEHQLPAIGRIADVVWISQKIVFEIQCSYITRAEVEARNSDYSRAGYQVIWILHDTFYNRRRLTAMECFLEEKPHFFSDMRSDGRGRIYDQFSIVNHAVRIAQLPPLAIDVRDLNFIEEGEIPLLKLLTLKNRVGRWKGYFAGDLLDLVLNVKMDQHMYLFKAGNLEAKYLFYGWKEYVQMCRKWLGRVVFQPYRIFLRNLLERYSKS